MQHWLFWVGCITTVINHIAITDLITQVYGQGVSRLRKVLFALILALALDQLWIYGIYVLGSYHNFSPLTYALIVHPNPIFALLHYWLGIEVLGFSKYRSVRLMRTAYLYMLVVRCLGELMSGLIVNFAGGNGGDRYNYLLDILCTCAGMLMNLLLYAVLRSRLGKNRLQVQLFDSLPVKNLPLEISMSYLQSSLAYTVCTMVPYYFKRYYSVPKEAYLTVEILFFVLLMLANTLAQYTRTLRQAIDNKSTNTQVLLNAVDDFSGLKHDFFNILQTYEGYISIGDFDKLKQYHRTLRSTADSVTNKLDLAHQMLQNPELTSILIEKQQQAAVANTQLTLKLLCDISDFYIPGADLCRSISLLLDTLLGQCPEKKNTIFSVEQKSDRTKLVMINSSREKKNGLSRLESFADSQAMLEVRQILCRHNNVFFHGIFDDDNLFAYIELRPV